MNSATIDLLQSSLSDVLERYAFVFGDAAEAQPDLLLQPGRINVSLDFKGARTGTMILSVPEQTATEMTVNLLGGDDVTPQQRDDAMKELLNVLCGHLLLHVYGGEVLFELGAPAISNFAEAPKAEWTTSALDVDGEIILALFKASPA